jgi:hypothetical protein
MTKKTTKKVASKPLKKTAKVKSAPLPKGPTKKLAEKKSVPAKGPVKPAVKPPAAKQAVKPAKSIAPEKTAKAEIVKPTKTQKSGKSNSELKVDREDPQEKTIIKPVGKKSKKPDSTEVEDTELAPLQDSMPTRKGRKYEGATEEESKWLELRDKNKNIKPRPYKLSETYEEKTPIEHKVLGWGIILSVVNDRLEVLFRSGIKHLISNYKPNS